MTIHSELVRIRSMFPNIFQQEKSRHSHDKGKAVYPVGMRGQDTVSTSRPILFSSL